MSPHSARILLVDDEPSLLEMLGEFLRDAMRLRSLQDHGCTYAQGDALAPVMDETALLDYLQSRS